MQWFNHTLKTAVLGVLFTACGVQAEDWNDARISKLSKEAYIQLDKFIKGDKTSTVYELPRSTQEALINIINRENTDYPSLARLKHKEDVLELLIKKTYGKNSIRYAALLKKLADPMRQNRADLTFYGVLLKYDGSAKYAFDQMDRLDLDSEVLQKWRKVLHDKYGFKATRAYTETEQEKPQVCVRFNETVRPEPAQQWQKFFTVAPAPSGEWAYKGNELCFGGEWQTTYTVKIDKRLQAKNLLRLESAIEETVATGRRDPMIRLASAGQVLDAYSQRQLGLSTVNIDNVAVELWQIPANNLSNARIQSLVRSPQSLSHWRVDDILSSNAEKRFAGKFNVGKYQSSETVTTNIGFDDMLKGKKAQAGIYVLTAKNADTGDSHAQIAFALSNAGFSSYLTEAGLWAELRDLSSTAPIAGQTVTLYAKNNRILGTAVTDENGVAHFDKPLVAGKDSQRPSHIIAENADYFAYLALSQPVDLSDKGLSGQVVGTAPLRSWIWADRGIYRPNDDAHLMWLLKTPAGKAFASAPVWLELRRPDGKIVHDEMIKADASGSYSFDYHFANSARQGDWQVRLSLGKDGAFLASKTLPVAAITPQQVEAKIQPLDKPLALGETRQLTVQADWLYGAPASDLPAYVEQTVSARDNWPAWKAWQVGLHDEKRYHETDNSDEKNTDSSGAVSFSINTQDLPFSTKPLSLKAVAKVTEPSGQLVKARYEKAIERQQPYLAIKKDAAREAQVALLDDQGQLQAGRAAWKLYRLSYDYYWYRSGGDWHYQHHENRQLVTTGTVTLSADKPSVIDNLPLDDGAWVLAVRGQDAAVASSVALEFGEYARPMQGSAPDRVTVTSNKERYADGETVSVHLKAPFDGQASVKFAHNDAIIDNRLVNFVDGQATLTFTWKKAWDDGLWLLANAWNKDQKTAHNRRAVGLAWVGGDLAPYTLDVGMQAPKTALPNTQLSIPLSIPAAQANTPTWARVAIIDDGLYGLAKASFSNPLNAFWDKKQLHADFFDVWGDIIRQVQGRQAALRSGAGDDEGSESSALKALPELDLQLVTYWSKPVQFDADGKAVVKMDLPQFNGRLRVMVATWNDEQLGAVEDTLQVRAPLVSTLYTPPYLSPGDNASLRLRLHNTTDKAMDLSATVKANGITLAKTDSETLTLAPEQVAWVTRRFSVQRNRLAFETRRAGEDSIAIRRDGVTPYQKLNDSTVAKNAAGRATMEVQVSGDAELNLQRFADIRLATAPQKTQTLTQLEGKASVARQSVITLASTSDMDALADDILPANQTKIAAINDGKLVERQVFVSTNAPFNPQSALHQLSVYPYGCVEQTTSKAWNNLLLNKLKRYQLPKSWYAPAVQKQHLFEAHSKLANLQHRDGGFSLWGYGRENLWLSAYVTEFLLDAQQAGQLGNERALRRALDYLRASIMQDPDDEDGEAYAHYVLAKAGEPVQGATVRFAEETLEAKNYGLQLPQVHTVAALVQHGEWQLATRLMKRLIDEPISSEVLSRYSNYGAELRNLAQMMTVLHEVNAQLKQLGKNGKLKTTTQLAISTLWPKLRQALENADYYNTQDLHWLANLAAELPNSTQTAELTINGKALAFTGSKRLTFEKNEALRVENLSDVPVYVTVNDWVAPSEQRVVENRYKIAMRYEDDKGNAVDISQLKHNQQVLAIATISTEKTGNHSSDLLFAYPLPAGLSIVPMAQDFEDKADRAWFKQLKRSDFSEDRDDRHIAAFSVGSKAETFTHAFMLRASRKGQWHAPEYSVENMYQPSYRASYPAPVVTVK